MARILWLDNDRFVPRIYILGLMNEGHVVKHVYWLSEAIEEIKSNQYGLVILDVMLMVTEDEQEEFPDGETNRGQNAGLVFYHKYGHFLKMQNTSVLVLTIRSDPEIRKAFTEAGLPDECFAHKAELARAETFLEKIAALIG
ncbi:hypothetical protein ACFL6S_26570 [Candidatus Poribacteria bacterium]